MRTFNEQLHRINGTRKMTLEQLRTAVIGVEGIVNARPLTYVDSDPNSEHILSPAYLITGKPPVMPEDPQDEQSNETRPAKETLLKWDAARVRNSQFLRATTC